jgi:transposase InsO family protein
MISLTFGQTPQKIMSDNGTEFKKGLSEHLEKMGIKHCRGRVRRPQTQGSVESFNKTVQRALLNLVEEAQVDC